MMTRRSPSPARRTSSRCASGAAGWRPGWIISGAPVCLAASAAARSDFCSFGVHGQEQPISPINPARTPVSPAPSLTSRTISRVIASSVFASMSGGWDGPT